MKLAFLKIFLATTLIIGGLTSCSTANTQSEKSEKSEKTSLLGKWELNDIADIKASSLSEAYSEGVPTINFISNKMVSASDGCNLLNGGITVSGNNITFGNLISTMKACDSVEDQNFASKLQGTLQYKLSDDKLELLQGDKTILTFIRPSKIEGSWVLEEFIGKDRSLKTVNDRFPNEKPTLTFTKNIISGNNGCNNINGAYLAIGNSLKMKDVAVTAMACEGVESDVFMERFDNINKYEIKDGKLILFANDIKTMVFKKK
ncbi:META domain-containing protein [Chishuiella sp.]|uniref:META domain-containing protein n=1 Tax=Chishuiella sp. TaxID=1969467 RepID=UPI0028AF883D|nr:META domain-containing protein [Chishuiella sp.]